MNIGIVGGGPAGLYLSLLMKKVNPSNEIRLAEVNPPHHTYGRLCDARGQGSSRKSEAASPEVHRRLRGLPGKQGRITLR